jgi:hypothetical protein
MAKRKHHRNQTSSPSLPVAADETMVEQTTNTISPEKLAANQANAQASTGPRTEAGKSRSSLNAVKTGLTGRTVLLPTDDVAAYEAHILGWKQELRPVGMREAVVVQSIADSHWRTERITRLEFAIYAQGRVQFAEQFVAEQDHATAAQMIELQTYLTYERQLRNLSVQDTRLRRNRERDLEQLQNLQNARRSQFDHLSYTDRLDKAAELYDAALGVGNDFDPDEFGFDFSLDTIVEHHEWLKSEDDEEEEEEQAGENEDKAEIEQAEDEDAPEDDWTDSDATTTDGADDDSEENGPAEDNDDEFEPAPFRLAGQRIIIRLP